MKKILSVLLAAAMLLVLCGGLAACQKAEEPAGPLRVLLDWGSTDLRWDEQDFAKELKRAVTDKGGPEDMEIITLPSAESDPEERDMQLKHIRTEIMAGGGPDVFISNRMGYDSTLLLMPEKSMKLGLLLGLDDYIENAQFIDWEGLNPLVISAGVNEKYGRCILPLTYSFGLDMFRTKDAGELPTTAETTWADMLSDPTGLLAAVAAPDGLQVYEFEGETFLNLSASGISGTFGKRADYENNRLAFTEEELLTRVQEYITLVERKLNGDFADVPQHFFISSMGSSYETMNMHDEYWDHIEDLSWDAAIVRKTELTMIPIYSDDGGVTAMIDSYAAVNANTRRPDEAFFVLDVLMSREFMQTSTMFATAHAFEVPVYDDFMSKNAKIASTVVNREKRSTLEEWFMYPSNYENFLEVKGQVTQAVFRDTLNYELVNCVAPCVQIYSGYQEGSIEDEVHKAYSRMQRRLSE